MPLLTCPHCGSAQIAGERCMACNRLVKPTSMGCVHDFPEDGPWWDIGFDREAAMARCRQCGVIVALIRTPCSFAALGIHDGQVYDIYDPGGALIARWTQDDIFKRIEERRLPKCGPREMPKRVCRCPTNRLLFADRETNPHEEGCPERKG